MRVNRLQRAALAALALALTAAGCSSGEAKESTTETASKCPEKSTGAPGGGSETDPIVQIAGALPDDAAGLVDAGLFETPPPWTIGMTHFGVNANTWTQQVVHETEAAVAANPDIEDFILLDADLKQDKQVADIEDLIAQEVDAIIVMPLTPTSADPGIEAAKAAGIPVVLHTGRVETDAWTTQLQGGAENFGRVMGQYLVDCTGGEGNIWVLRGLSGHPEDTNRYNGLVESLEGTNLKISSEEYGDWQYDTTKPICEQLLIDDPDPVGIWSSGADMTRACVDVFEEMGQPIPPITGEGNNGYMVQAVEKDLNTISAVYSPAQGAAGVRLAVALLEGDEVARSYKYEPPGDLLDNIEAQHDPELSDNVWWPSELDDDQLQESYAN
jgi:ribose transport system substrate-binding protein